MRCTLREISENLEPQPVQQAESARIASMNTASTLKSTSYGPASSQPERAPEMSPLPHKSNSRFVVQAAAFVLALAAVIAIPHPQWQERPLLLVQAKPGTNPTKESILEFLSTRIAKFWMPDDVIFVESLPHTATGKLLKTELRAKYGGQIAVAG